MIIMGLRETELVQISSYAYFMSKAAVEMAPAIVDAGIDMAKG